MKYEEQDSVPPRGGVCARVRCVSCARRAGHHAHDDRHRPRGRLHRPDRWNGPGADRRRQGLLRPRQRERRHPRPQDRARVDGRRVRPKKNPGGLQGSDREEKRLRHVPFARHAHHRGGLPGARGGESAAHRPLDGRDGSVQPAAPVPVSGARELPLRDLQDRAATDQHGHQPDRDLPHRRFLRPGRAGGGAAGHEGQQSHGADRGEPSPRERSRWRRLSRPSRRPSRRRSS